MSSSCEPEPALAARSSAQPAGTGSSLRASSPLVGCAVGASGSRAPGAHSPKPCATSARAGATRRPRPPQSGPVGQLDLVATKLGELEHAFGPDHDHRRWLITIRELLDSRAATRVERPL